MKIKPQKPKGFPDYTASTLVRRLGLIKTLDAVAAGYGYAPLDTPCLEYADILGKHLPDEDRPDHGVFSLRDDKRWLTLRYDLTMPLARYAAENAQTLVLPFKRRQSGYVWRNEKPDPGRFRQFMQYDLDCLGAPCGVAEAELLLVLAEVFAPYAPARDMHIHLHDRRLFAALLRSLRADLDAARRLRILRSMDKRDRLGENALISLLGAGRKDASGDFTQGAALEPADIDRIVAYMRLCVDKGNNQILESLRRLFADDAEAQAALDDLAGILAQIAWHKPASRMLRLDTGIIRGLDYYTGPVFEVIDHTPDRKSIGSLAGGGRYDSLVGRFIHQDIRAVGLSFGLSRMGLLQTQAEAQARGVLFVLMDKTQAPRYQQLAGTLRAAGIAASVYAGAGGLKKQLKYADKARIRFAVIEGEDERKAGVMQIKDLEVGRLVSAGIEDHATWKKTRPAQRQVDADSVIACLCELCAVDTHST